MESLRQAGWFDIFESDIQALLIFDPLITLWGKLDAPYLKMLNDASMASACSYVRTCRRVRNSKKIATIRDFHLPGSFLCLSTRLKSKSSLCGQIYFRNKGGLKLFLFQEYGPISLYILLLCYFMIHRKRRHRRWETQHNLESHMESYPTLFTLCGNWNKE